MDYVNKLTTGDYTASAGVIAAMNFALAAFKVANPDFLEFLAR